MKQTLYYFTVTTPRFGTGPALPSGKSHLYAVATDPYEARCQSSIVKIGSHTLLGPIKSIEVASEHASRAHAVIEFEGDVLTLIDLGNEPCTRLNGVRISKVRVDKGDKIHLGVKSNDGKIVSASDITTIEYMGSQEVMLTPTDNPHPFVSRMPIVKPGEAAGDEVLKPFLSNPATVIDQPGTPPTMTTSAQPSKKRSHERRPLVFPATSPHGYGNTPLSPAQMFHLIRLAARLGEATAQTRKPAEEALRAFLHGLNVDPNLYMPKDSQ